MHIVAQISDPFPFGSSTISVDYKQEAYSSLSDAASSNTTKPHWDEEDEVILATSRPKKRAGRRIFRETRHPVFRGVRRRNGNKWVCELREPNKKTRIWLGTYSTPEMAARAHDVAALALRGKSACLNFADSVWRLPVPISNDAGDIRKAAAEAAEMFRPLSPRCHQELSSSKEACSEETLKNAVEQENNNVLFVDEEATFDMPRLLTDMAHGLLLSPPHCAGGGFGWDDEVFMETDADMLSLWNF